MLDQELFQFLSLSQMSIIIIINNKYCSFIDSHKPSLSI